ncbi:hypothetical protein GIV55_24390, partial [Pseudomonas syringae]|nr:hypothetical protein [Pseudomonas syringae]
MTLSLDSPDGIDHGFEVLAFTGHEAISQPFCFTLDLVSERASLEQVSERASLDLESLLGQPAFLQFA